MTGIDASEKWSAIWKGAPEVSGSYEFLPKRSDAGYCPAQSRIFQWGDQCMTLNKSHQIEDPILRIMVSEDIPITLENYVSMNGLNMEDMEAERMSMLPFCLKELTAESEALVQEVMHSAGCNRYEAIEIITAWRELEEL